MALAHKHCIPCKEGTPALPAEEAQALSKEVPSWTITPPGTWLIKSFKFKSFVEALAFVNKVGEVAEAEQHHPDIELGWGYADIHLQTHAAEGLHENDFIVAAKIDQIG